MLLTTRRICRSWRCRIWYAEFEQLDWATDNGGLGQLVLGYGYAGVGGICWSCAMEYISFQQPYPSFSTFHSGYSVKDKHGEQHREKSATQEVKGSYGIQPMPEESAAAYPPSATLQVRLQREGQHGEQHREEVGDGKNVKGSYGFTDARGIHRQVNYVADHAGFRAQVKTNEPGTANQNPAAVHIISDAPYGHGGYAGVGGAGYGYAGVGAAGLGYGYGGLGAAGLGYGYAGVGGYGGLGYGGYGLGNGRLAGLGYARYGF
ncbi:Cuticle protein 16.8 like protein [Argiope bruennichi]|uniref:Cuticle protein 16.8 like protein n=1 Tax=Argiope bruennichi TaxID=94029 RepID=A0A8T0E5Y7_ARGBR|nr:Cuticle protein 16.8 like protein [Argiope bruennichi]